MHRKRESLWMYRQRLYHHTPTFDTCIKMFKSRIWMLSDVTISDEINELYFYFTFLANQDTKIILSANMCLQSLFWLKLAHDISFYLELAVVSQTACTETSVKSNTIMEKKNNLPPETGASIKTAPNFSAAEAISLETAGSMVLESMSREPFFTFLVKKRND